MAENQVAVILFDLGDTLGTSVLSPPPYHLIGFDVFGYVPPILQSLQEKGLRLGVISNTGDDPGVVVNSVLGAAGILRFFDAGLLIYSKDVGQSKNSPAIFRLAAERAGLADAKHRCLYVGEDAKERAFAMDVGLKVAPHPLLVQEVLAGQGLRYIRITVPPDQAASPWREALRNKSFVPLHVTGRRGTVVYAITSQRMVPELINMRFGVELLGEPDAPLRTELYILQDDAAAASGFLSAEGQSTRLFTNESDARMVMSSTSEGIVIALPAERSLENFHFDKAWHGHNLKLMPDPSLLEPFGFEDPAHAPG